MATLTASPSAPQQRRTLLLGLLAGMAMPSLAGAAATSPNWQPLVIPQARQLDLTSAHTGQRYRIFISVPDGAPPPDGHPVLYLLDGNATFPSAALMARSAARRSKASGRPAPVVVGIGYASGDDYDSVARSRDYTPAAGGKTGKGEGGADLFLDFIEHELKPLIQATVPINPLRQSLFGHSYGGLLTLHALFTRPASFQTYIAASPSIWYGERYILNEVSGLLAARQHKASVLLTVGELEHAVAPPGAKTVAGQQRMVDEVRDLAALLEAQKQRYGLERAGFFELARENHGSALFPSLSRGMEFLLA